MQVAIAGGGLAGLSCAKYLVDQGHTPIIYERRDVLGGLVAAWKDEDGDWYETGLHIFFGAYPNMLQLFKELGIEERLQWKQHTMIFNQPDKPGTYSRFDFPNVAAPWNGLAAIARNNDMLSWPEKVRLGVGLLPAMIKGQDYAEEMDKYSWTEWCNQHGIPKNVTNQLFLAASKSLNFINPEEITATVMFSAFYHFMQEQHGSRVAFLDGAPPERLCQPIVDYIIERGGEIHLSSPIKEIRLKADDTVHSFLMRGLNGADDYEVTADAYVSAMPVDPLKVMLPEPWQKLDCFKKMQGLEGVPVINIHLWFDRKLTAIDNLLFSRSPLLSVYADMSNTCREYADPDKSMLELVLAPAKDWISKSEDEILAATMEELKNLFPTHFEGNQSAQLLKHKIVITPRSVYKAIPGSQKCRPDQVTPIDNFFLAGSYTMQEYLGSMEGAVLSGKLAAQAIAKSHLSDQPSDNGNSASSLSNSQPLTHATTA